MTRHHTEGLTNGQQEGSRFAPTLYPAAAAADDPLLEPPGVCSKFHASPV